MSETKFTKGPWRAINMVAENGEPLTIHEIGEMVKDATRVNALNTEFLAVEVERDDQKLHVCIVGNGRDSPYNALLIQAAPQLYKELNETHAILTMALELIDRKHHSPIMDQLQINSRVLAHARGEA